MIDDNSNEWTKGATKDVKNSSFPFVIYVFVVALLLSLCGFAWFWSTLEGPVGSFGSILVGIYLIFYLPVIAALSALLYPFRKMYEYLPNTVSRFMFVMLGALIVSGLAFHISRAMLSSKLNQ